MMSQSAQSLYFHIGMNADDDGFCEVFTIMRMTESKPDDLKVLHSKGFIYVCDERVCIVSDWHKNNLIRKDRYTQSEYLKDQNIKEIYIAIMDEKISQLEQYKEFISGQPTVNQRLPQVRLGKDRLDKVKKEGTFVPPSLMDVITYCKERNNNVDPEKFFNFYEAKGWMIGKNKMKDWRAAVRTWEKSSSNGGAREKQQEKTVFDDIVNEAKRKAGVM